MNNVTHFDNYGKDRIDLLVLFSTNVVEGLDSRRIASCSHHAVHRKLVILHGHQNHCQTSFLFASFYVSFHLEKSSVTHLNSCVKILFAT